MYNIVFMKSEMRFAIFLVLFQVSACEAILDKEPIAILDAGSFFQTENDAVQSINAAYNPLLFNNANNNFLWAFAEVTGDAAIPEVMVRGQVLWRWKLFLIPRGLRS